jgi:membrane fusion protein, multidrug efflux system
MRRRARIEGVWHSVGRCAVAAIALVAGALAAASCSSSTPADAPKKGEGKAVPVSVAAAVLKTLPLELKTFGTVETPSPVTVRAEVNGLLLKVHFQKGQDVQKNDLLFTIDPRPYEVAIKQAKAVQTRDQVLSTAAAAEAERQKALVDKGILSRSDYEKVKADADSLAATLEADAVAIETATIQWERCFIRSPLAGRAGNLLVTEGNYIKVADVPLVVINQVSPIEVFFSISQAELAQLRRFMGAGRLKVAATLAQEPDRPEVGELEFIDNTLDKSSGTVQLAGRFDNKDRRLWPGQYVAVVLAMGELKDAVTVPSQAVQTGRDSKYVMVVRPDGIAEMRPVTVGLVYEGDTVVETNLKAGEVVVTDGHVRLKAGDRTEVKAAVAKPAGAAAPAPDAAAPKAPGPVVPATSGGGA